METWCAPERNFLATHVRPAPSAMPATPGGKLAGGSGASSASIRDCSTSMRGRAARVVSVVGRSRRPHSLRSRLRLACRGVSNLETGGLLGKPPRRHGSARRRRPQPQLTRDAREGRRGHLRGVSSRRLGASAPPPEVSEIAFHLTASRRRTNSRRALGPRVQDGELGLGYYVDTRKPALSDLLAVPPLESVLPSCRRSCLLQSWSSGSPTRRCKWCEKMQMAYCVAGSKRRWMAKSGSARQEARQALRPQGERRGFADVRAARCPARGPL